MKTIFIYHILTPFLSKLLIITCILIAILHPLAGQDMSDHIATDKDTTLKGKQLSEVTVRAFEQDRKLIQLPAAVFYLPSSSLDRYANTDLVSAINTIPGVRMQQRSPESFRFDIRGSSLRSPWGIRNVKMYYNGIPLTDPGGNTYLNQLSFDDIHSLTVIKGPAGSLYGGGTGGVVLLQSDLFSEDSSDHKLVSAGFEAGSYGLQKTGVKFRWGNDKTEQELRYENQRSDGYRSQTASHKKTLAYEALLKGKNGQKLSFLAHYTDLYYQIPGALTKAQYEQNPKASLPATGSSPSAVENKTAVYHKDFLVGVNYLYPITPHLASRFVVYGAYTDFENPTTRNYEFRKEPHFGGRFVFNYDRWFRSTHAKFWLGGEIQQGFYNVTDHENIQGSPGAMMNDDNVDNHTSIVFAQADLLLPHGWEVTAAASLHQAKVKFTRLYPTPVKILQTTFNQVFSPRLALSKKIGLRRSLYLDISSGYSPPAVSELLPSTSVINTSLQAEKGISYTLGSRGYLFHQKLYYDAGVFLFNLSKSIALRRDSSNADYFVNAGGTRQHGIETFLSYPVLDQQRKTIKAWISSSWFDFRYKNYQVTDKDYSGKKLPGVSPFTLTTGIDLTLASGLSAFASYTCRSSEPLNDRNSVYASAYNLVGFKINYDLKLSSQLKATIFGGVDNLLDETYSLGNDINAFGGRYFNAAPGINFYVSVILKYLMH